jgi:hypothetical protein
MHNGQNQLVKFQRGEKMKAKVFIVAVFVAACAAQSALATSAHSYRPNPQDLYDLDHYKAYLWGLELNIGPGEEITSVSLLFKQIRDANWLGCNDLWLTLIDEPNKLGVKTYNDHDAYGNYFANWDSTALELNHYHNISHNPHDILYNFSADEITALNDYADDGKIALGFDPDCHLDNCYVEFCVETDIVPEPGSFAMVSMGTVAFGLAFFGRRILLRKRG